MANWRGCATTFKGDTNTPTIVNNSPHKWLPPSAELVGTKNYAGRVWSITTMRVGPDQPDPRPNPNQNANPLGGSRSAGAATRLRTRAFWWRLKKKLSGGRKASLDQ